MERTESIVIQVAPSYENNKIKEMGMFGWNLQGRQEMHEEGDAYGSPSAFGNSYVIKTKVSHYVKLHFVRSLNLPNLDKIKRIESQIDNLPFPEIPSTKKFMWPIILILIGVINLTNPDGGIPAFFIFVLGGGFWLFTVNKKRQANSNICQESLKKEGQLKKELETVTI